MSERRQFEVTETAVPGQVRVSMADCVHELDQHEAVVFAAEILAAAGVKYMIEVSG